MNSPKEMRTVELKVRRLYLVRFACLCSQNVSGWGKVQYGTSTLFQVPIWRSPPSFRSTRLDMAEKIHHFCISVFRRFRRFMFIKCKQTRKSSNQDLYAKWGFHPEVSTKLRLETADKIHPMSDHTHIHPHTIHPGFFSSLMES